MRWEEGHNHDKIKSHTHWVHPRPREQITEVLLLLWRLWGLCQASQPGVLQGIRKSQGIWLWRPVGFDCRFSTGLEEIETLLLQGTHKILCKLRPKAKEQLSHRRLKIYLLVLEGLLQRHGVAVAHHRDKGTSNRNPRSTCWQEPSWKSPYHRACRLQGWVASGQTTNRDGEWPHLWADKQIKVLLSMALPTRTKPSYIHCWSFPSGILHKPLSLIYQKANSRSKNYSPAAFRLKPQSQKVKRKYRGLCPKWRNKIGSQKNN